MNYVKSLCYWIVLLTVLVTISGCDTEVEDRESSDYQVQESLDMKEMELEVVDIEDLMTYQDFDSVSTENLNNSSVTNEFQALKCKRRFPINRWNFRIKAEGVNIPVKGGSAVSVGSVSLSNDIGSAITETLLALDGYSHSNCQSVNAIGQIAMSCGEGASESLIDLINLKTMAELALNRFFLAMKTVQNEEEIRKALNKMNESLDKIEDKLSKNS